MAESQLVCMEDGQIGASVPESEPRFYYSEAQRAALEELLKNGDSAFKTRLEEDKTTDFLSAREIKSLRNNLVQYKPHVDEEERKEGEEAARHSKPEPVQRKGPGENGSKSLRSTYWPQQSDTEIPELDIGWTGHTGFFRGVTRVSVHTHPPKDNGPHIKEVVRKLIQDATKLIAIVMDLLTDLHILQDLLDAASKRHVPVYIILDLQGVPHFLDMCNRLKIDAQNLQNIRTRTVRGVGFDMSFGRLPGGLCYKYMLIDGDKVAFGSYSYSWSTARMDRNMITVMSGQIVDYFDQDFRELYAISDKLNLFKEFHVDIKPRSGTMSRATISKRPTVTATSRFQVSLGEAGDLKVPAHKYYNPKYLLAFGGLPDKPPSVQDVSGMTESELEPSLIEPSPETVGQIEDRPMPVPSPTSKGRNGSWLGKLFKRRTSKKERESVASACPSPTSELPHGLGDLTEEEMPAPVKSKKKSGKESRKKKNATKQNNASPEDLDSKRETCSMS